MQYRFKRRSFLAGIGAAAGLAALLRRVEQAEAQVLAPQRILFVQRPVGTVPQNWFPLDQGQSFTLSRILQPFAPLRDRLVLFEDLSLPYQGSVGGGAERGTVLMLTGRRTRRLYPGNGGDDPAMLLRARRQRKSVLDFMRRDHARLRQLAPASQREQLDMHAAAIREMELAFDALPGNLASCSVPAAPEVVSVSTQLDPYSSSHVVPQRDDETLARIGELHMALIKAAFRCDLTRTVTFQWTPGNNHVSFGGIWPPDPTVFKVHHTTSHDPGSPDLTEFLTRVEEFYARHVAKFVQDLAAEPEPGGNGSLLDNTLVPYITEVAERSSTWTRMPYLLLGGKNLGLIGNRRWTNDPGGFRFTNDLWLAIAEAFGMPGFVLGDDDLHTTPIAGLFA